MAASSSMKSPSWLSSSSPIGVSRETGSWLDLLDLANALGGQTHLLADFLRRGVATELLKQLTLDTHELIDRLDHVHGNTDGTGLVGDSARDGLTNPPRGIRGELEALSVVELLDGADETEVAFLDEVEEQHAAADIALRDRHDKTQVRFDKLLLRVDAHLLDARQATALAALELDALLFGLLELGGGGDAGLYLHGEVDFLGGRQQGNLADFFKVHAHGVAREHGDGGVGRTAAHLRSAGGYLGQVDFGVFGGLELFLGNALEQVLVVRQRRVYLLVFESHVAGKSGILSFCLAFLGIFNCFRFGSRHRCYPFAAENGRNGPKDTVYNCTKNSPAWSMQLDQAFLIIVVF